MPFQDNTEKQKASLIVGYDVNEFGLVYLLLHLVNQYVNFYVRRVDLGMQGLEWPSVAIMCIVSITILALPYFFLMILKRSARIAYAVASIAFWLLISFGAFDASRRIALQFLAPQYGNFIYFTEIENAAFGGLELIFITLVVLSGLALCVERVVFGILKYIMVSVVYLLIVIWWYVFYVLHGDSFLFMVVGFFLVCAIVIFNHKRKMFHKGRSASLSHPM